MARNLSIEFQLVEHKDFGIIGRVFIPVQCRGMGKVNGKLVYDSDLAQSEHKSNKGGSRTIEFIGTVSEYEHCLKAFGGSNFRINRERTAKLFAELKLHWLEAVLHPVEVEIIPGSELLDLDDDYFWPEDSQDDEDDENFIDVESSIVPQLCLPAGASVKKPRKPRAKKKAA